MGATGIYQLVVTAPNACTATATTEVLEDRTEPGATAVGDTLTCQLGLVTLLGSSPSSPVTYAWTGPGTFNSNIANPSTSIPGRYELRVSGANGCFSLDTAFVASSIDPPGALAQSPDTLNCAIGTVQLLAASPTAGVDYFWRGPDLFSSIDQNPQVSQPGEYILVVTAPNSCRSQDTVVVVADTISPDVLVRNDTLDCQDNLAQLIGSSSTPGVTYDWSGPGGFGSNLPDPTTTDPGVYRLTVTAPNACTATATTEVIEDRDLPDIFVGADTLTCARDTIELRGSSSTLGVAYTWSGPGGFGSNLPQPEVDQAGVYYLTVLAPNACSAQDSIEVFADLDPPGALAEADTINCQNNPASLFGSATSAATDLTFQWTGPSAFSSTLANPLVSEGGLYILEVTAANGCQSRDSVTMLSDIDPPGAFAAVADSLNCVQTTVTLSGNSPTGGVDYFWLGPDLFSSIDQNPTVDRPGTYQLFVSGPNACVSIDMVTVVLDTLRPDAQALGDTLNCQDNSVTLLGSSTTPGVSYSWTGPGGFVALVANPVVTEAGPYELIVRADNGCTAVDTAHVWEDENLPGALALADTLNCIRDTVSLLGSSPTAGVDYFWLGPGSFTSGEQNPRVGREGEYLLFVTGPNGCESHFTLQVIRDTLAPLLSLRADTLDCRTDSVQLQPSSTGRGLTYAWSGPGGFSSTQAAPLVDATGTYTLRVRASNACTAEASIVVLSDTQEPDLMSRGDTLTCARDSVALGATSSTLGVQYQWVGPGGFNSALANPRAGMPGDYYLTATAPNGCSVLDTIAVPLDTLAPEVEALGGILGCQSNGLQLGSVVTPLDTDLRWEGPGGWTSDAPDPLVFISGSYVLVATAGNGCSARDTALVEEDVNLPGASILGDTLTCASDSIRLEGNSPTAMVSYAWTGPGGFGSSLPNPMIAQPGLYTLVVTGPNACQSQEQITIEQDTLSPAFSLSADTLDCNRDSIQLQVSATGSVASYTWTGPGTFVSTIPQPYAFVAGTYQLTAIGTNACVASDSIQVIDASRFPDALARGDTLTCARDTVQLLGISATLDVSYSWTGPGSFASTEQNPRIATAGAYYLTVRSAENCETSDTVLILEDLQVPGALARGDTIDCQSGRVQLVANSPTAGATYSWTGPSGFSSNQQQPEVMVAGDYYLLVTGPNGCASRDTARVLEDLEVPGASIVGDTLDCARDSIPLLGNSPTAGVSYSWTGPGFSSNQQSPRVGAAGLYTLTVVAPNACESVAQFEVLVDTIAPGALAIGDTLDCRFNPLQVSATSPTAGVSYFWEGPGGFSSTLPNPNVAELGTYRLLVRGPNACESRDTVLVIEDIVLPGALAQGDTLTCGIDSIQLLGNSPTPGVSYSWTGPGTYASGLQNPFANRGGTYVLTVRDAEGCISLDSTVLTVDTLAPTFMVFNDTLNCRDTLIALNASSATLGLSYAWTGPGGFQSQLSQPEIDRPGAYFLEVTGPNQCRSRDTLRIEQDILEPGAQALGDTLDCGRDSVDLWAQALVDPVRYAWTGPGGFSSSQRGPRIGMPGWYRLRTEGRNFCQSTDSIFIVQDRSLPEAIALGDTLNCGRDSVQLEGQSTSASAQFSWRGPGGFSSGERDPTVGLSGWYFLTVRGTNDCEAVDSALVETDFEQPDVLALGDTLNCGAPIGQLLGMSATSGVRYTWTGPGGFSAASANPNVSDPGTYILEVVAPNFCEARDTVEVLEDVVLPGATALGGTIDCARDMVQLEGNSVTAGVTYSWTGPDAYSSNQQNPSVATGGSYTLTVTAPNGCESLTSAQVVVDTLPPDLLAFTDTLDCNTGVAEISAQSGTPGVSYDWTGPDGFMANVPNPIVVDSGWYTIVLTAPNFCRDSARVLVVPETNLPLAEAGVAGLLNCEVMRVALDAGASQGEANLAYQWRAADGSPLGNTSMVEVEASGWYFVEVTNPSNACSDLDSVLVGIDTLSPTAFVNPIGGLSLTCSTTSIVLDASGSAGPGALGFEWWWEREAESSEVNYEITRPGQYTLIVTNLENACRDSVAVNIVEDNDLPLILIGPPDILNCRRVVLELDASASSSGNGYVYQWSGPSILSGATTPQARVDQPGIYQLLLTNTSTGCRDSASVRVDADFEFPLAEAGAGGTLDCETLRLSLDGSASSQGSDFAYQWTGPGLLGAGMALRAEVDQAGQYWFTVTDSTNGCTSTDSVLVALGNLGPQDLFIDLVEPTCFGDRDGALLIDSVVGGLGPYLYGLEGEALVSWPTFDRLPVGTYRLTIQDSEGCELDTLVELAGAGPIGVQLGPDTTIQLGQSVELLGQVQSDRPFEFRWAENPWLLCDSCLAQPIAPTRTVTVELEVEDEAGCRALDRQTIYVAEGSLIYVPSAFSPDGDGQNDWLEIFTSSGVQRINRFLIFNRWGAVVHEARDFLPGDPRGNWDGSFRGEPLNPAVFVYMAEVELLGGETRIFDGSITLVR
ncbi:MAG: gliding motility-associated C-terminal domain-containing protein [Bacteroidota bacterium]